MEREATPVADLELLAIDCGAVGIQREESFGDRREELMRDASAGQIVEEGSLEVDLEPSQLGVVTVGGRRFAAGDPAEEAAG